MPQPVLLTYRVPAKHAAKAQRNTILVRVICITLAALMILSVAAAALWR